MTECWDPEVRAFSAQGHKLYGCRCRGTRVRWCHSFGANRLRRFGDRVFRFHGDDTCSRRPHGTGIVLFGGRRQMEQTKGIARGKPREMHPGFRFEICRRSHNRALRDQWRARSFVLWRAKHRFRYFRRHGEVVRSSLPVGWRTAWARPQQADNRHSCNAPTRRRPPHPRCHGRNRRERGPHAGRAVSSIHLPSQGLRYHSADIRPGEEP